MCAALALIGLTAALPQSAYSAPNFPAETSSDVSAGFQSALTAYNKGEMATALIRAKTAGAGGDTDAQVLAAYIMHRGPISLRDLNDAVKWYLKAANSGHDDAMIALGELALENTGGLSAADGMKWLGLAANKGRTDAMRALADMYILGKGTPPNTAEAIKWLTKAVNYGDAFAERKLGDLHFDTDPKTALKWYETAAGHGDDEAAYIAAIMYVETPEIRPNSGRVAALLAQAANAGIAPAQADYGLIVYQGNGVDRSAQEAAQWFEKAAKGGDPEGRFLYAYTLAKGDGVPRSYEEAYYWLLKANADSGPSEIEDYNQDRQELKKRLEDNVPAEILQRARDRVKRETNSPQLISGVKLPVLPD